MAAKHTLEFARRIFREGDGKLLAKTYVNSRTKMPYICSCGNKSHISFNCFLRGHRCAKCRLSTSSKRSRAAKYTLEVVQNIFSKNGYKLLSEEYVNNHTVMSFICEHGHSSQISLQSFLQGGRCMECANIRIGDALRTPFETVYAAFAKVGLKLLSTTYKSNNQPLWYECQRCLAVRQTKYMIVRQGCGCKACAVEKLIGKKRHSCEFVRLLFLKNGLLLTSKNYKDANHSLIYRCLECGSVGSISISILLRRGFGKKGCRKCITSIRLNNKKRWNEMDVDLDFLEKILIERTK